MATHINTTNAIKGLACVTVHLKSLEVSFIYPALARHSIQHLTSAGLEIERLNSEAFKLRQRVTHLEEFNSSFEPKWDSLIFAIMGTDAGKNICKNGHDKTTELAIQAIHKTESERKEALRTAEAFQEAASHSRTVITHQLKILPEYFQAVIDGRKKAELRTNDRDFKVGDYLLLVEWDGGTDEYTGRKIGVEISDITQCDFAAPKLVLLSFFDPCDEIPF
ncbi:TPA: DUF3850 domain-containing protein [Yersinia enterocolitica]|nr:DUF3850 domain-containing protein [Yersinia enterocolitica]HDL7830495.1 DUF3850 domain-containing protein [Yersinia enterocolitica]HDL7871351.1 DUF3850 domain-containing protein [Yersinia enterocolitica]HDL7885035.1 DUF3850 domain-containing protein [Yersinia enterocolitica]HDL7892527.1 DUF3850 domain-containing protein [Yersinia enterocolitica]